MKETTTMDSQTYLCDLYNLAKNDSTINIDPKEFNSCIFYDQTMNFNFNVEQTNSLGFTKDSEMLEYNNFQYSPPAPLESTSLSRTDSLSSQLASDHFQSSFTEPQYYPTMNYNYILPQELAHPPAHSGLHSLAPSGYWPNQIPSGFPPKRIYSFVTMSQATTKKRLRRKFDEIERSFVCIHNNCRKAYGTLNNLNAHILMQGHGPKRTASEFKTAGQQQPVTSRKDIKNTYLKI